MIYLDNSATTKPYREVIEKMSEISLNYYGNPSSLHTFGIEAEKLILQSRQKIASILNVTPIELIFTSGGTEANNLAIKGYIEANKRKGNHIITTKIEHPSVLEVYKYYETKGFRVDYLDVDKNGAIDINTLEKLISSETILISIIYVNNETGTIQPLDRVIEIRDLINQNAAIHIDAVQAYLKAPTDMKKLSGVDMMTISSHKIHGPKGVGALYIKKGTKINSIVLGGGQELKLRSGTENVPGIFGFGLASEITYNNISNNYNKVLELNSYFRELLTQKIDRFKIISPINGLPYILNIAFERVKSEVLLHHLETCEIFVSTGSACSSKKTHQSHVLKAMNVEKSYLEGAIRVSFSSFNKKEEVEKTIEAINRFIPILRY